MPTTDHATVDPEGKEAGKKRRTPPSSETNGVPAPSPAAAAAASSPATTGPAPAAAAPKSFSLFDMLDAQPSIATAEEERVTADEILRIFREAKEEEEAAAAAGAKMDEAAALFERVDDLEDLTFDPFGGSGDVWPDVNEALRFGLGLAAADTASGVTAAAADADSAAAVGQPEEKTIVRFADVHSRLCGLCRPPEFARQRLDLIGNVTDAIGTVAASGRWYRAEPPRGSAPDGDGASGAHIQGERREQQVTVSLAMTELVRTWHGLVMPGLISVLDAVPDDDADGSLERMLRLLAMTTTAYSSEGRRIAVGPVHLIAALDPYADWFVHLARTVSPNRLVKLAIKSGLLGELVERCHAPLLCGYNGDCDGDTNSNDEKEQAGVVVGAASDLDHCLYLQSLSMLRSILVATAGAEMLFPYTQLALASARVDNGAGAGACVPKSSSVPADDVLRVLAPFQAVLAVGIDGGSWGGGGDGVVVDEVLAHLCGEAAEAVLRGGTASSRQTFSAVFSDFVDGTVRGILSSDSSSGGVVASSNEVALTPATVVFFRVCRIVLTTETGRNPPVASLASDTFLSSVASLVEAAAAVLARSTDCVASRVDDVKELSEILLILEPILECKALLAASKKEDMADAIRRYCSVAKKTGMESESTRVLRLLTATINGSAMLEDLGLIEECMY